MEHPFFPTTAATRVEALRWLSIAEKLLFTRDFIGSKSFATRARDSDPTLSPAEQILAIADTLIAGERRIGSNQPDWYAVLNLTRQQGHDPKLVASNYRNLALLLNPENNRFPLADEALRLVVDAWSLLSNPSRKSLFDKELDFTSPPQQQQADLFSNQNFVFFGGGTSSGVSHHTKTQGASHSPQAVSSNSVEEPQNFMNFASGFTLSFGSGPGIKPTAYQTVNKHIPEGNSTFGSNVWASPVLSHEQVNKSQKQMETNVKASRSVNVSERNEGLNVPANDEEGPTFWTACPYCYYMYEYPEAYVDCTLKCQNCKRAFQGIMVPSPPVIQDGQEGFFCCWGFLPLGFSSENWDKTKGAGSIWTPFSPMFSCPLPRNGNNAFPKQARRKGSVPRIYVDDDDAFIDVSDSSELEDEDWNREFEVENKLDNVKRKRASGTAKRTQKKVKADKGSDVKLPEGALPSEASNKTVSESSKKGQGTNGRKQTRRVAKKIGKLDLNVEFSNEAEEPVLKVEEQAGPSCGEDDNIEGIGFFEGLDEFLNSLPILSIVGDDKVVKAV